VALAFIAMATLAAGLAFGASPEALLVVAAAAFGAYMAINIGANDVANNMGPAVGAKALTMGGALVIAALCETAGALLAGGTWSPPSPRGSSIRPASGIRQCSSG
jgi:PiT family inorganic phosphate transporter